MTYLRRERWFWYVIQNDITVAKGDCFRKDEAEREAAHYAMMYSQDGPVKVKFRKTFRTH